MYLSGATLSPVVQTMHSGIVQRTIKSSLVQRQLGWCCENLMWHCLKSVESEDQAFALILEIRSLCTAGWFRVTKWIFNSHIVLASVPEDEKGQRFGFGERLTPP